MSKPLVFCLFLVGCRAGPLPNSDMEAMAEPEPAADPISEYRSMDVEPVAEHRSVDTEPLPEPMSVDVEPIIYNVVDEEHMYNNVQKGEPGVAVLGNYAFQEDGKTYQISYNADDQGYVAEGDLPVAPAAPVYEMLVPMQDTAEVMAAIEAHKHLYRAHQQAVEDARKPKESGVEVLRRRRSPVVIPEQPSLVPSYPSVLPYYQFFPTYTLPQVKTAEKKMDTMAEPQIKSSPIFIQPVLQLQHPTYSIGYPWRNLLQKSPVPAEIQDEEKEPAALAL